MSNFCYDSQLVQTEDNLNGTWTLTKPVIYKSDVLKTCILAPVGFITDYASIPQIFWSILPRSGEPYDPAAVIHDWLYSNMVVKFTRKQCDKVLLEAMGVLGVTAWKRYVIYLAVRIGGRKAWSKTHEPKCLNSLGVGSTYRNP